MGSYEFKNRKVGPIEDLRIQKVKASGEVVIIVIPDYQPSSAPLCRRADARRRERERRFAKKNQVPITHGLALVRNSACLKCQTREVTGGCN